MAHGSRALASSFIAIPQEPPAVRVPLAAAWQAARPSLPLFVPILLGAGIAGWFLLPTAHERLALLVAGLALALAGLALPRGRATVAAAGLLLATGVGIAEWRSAEVAGPRLHHRLTAEPIRGTLIGITPRDGGQSSRLLLLRDASAADPAHRVRISISGLPPPELRPGARIVIPATLGPAPGPVLPGAHDPARAAWFQGIAAIGRATGPPQLLAPAPLRPGQAWLDSRRADLADFLARQLPGDPGAIATALLVGEQGRIRPDLLDAFRIAGLAHLLTVSGFHIATAVAGTLFLVRSLVGLWPWLALRTSGRTIAAVTAGLAGTFYALMSGAEVPAVRAAIVAWIVLGALVAGRNPLSPRLIAFAATLILLVRPEALLDASFQLSFAAVTALALFARSPAGTRLFAPRGEGEGLAPLLARRLLALIATALVAEIVLTPIVLAHFGRAGLYGALANLVAMPLTSLVLMPLLAALLLLSLIGLAALPGLLLAPALALFAHVAETVAGWPGASYAVAALPPAAIGSAVAGGLLLGLVAGPLRWAGTPLLLAAGALALLTPRPDLLVSADGRQVAILADGRLYSLRATRGGFGARAWSEAADAPMDRRLADLPGARCSATGCTAVVGRRAPLRLLLLTDEEARPPPGLCAAADVIVAPGMLPRACHARWRTLDRRALRGTGAVAITADRRRLDSVAARAGDHPWSPATLPGTRTDLLGQVRWTGVIVE